MAGGGTWWRRFPLLPQRRPGSIPREETEGDGPRVKQVWKPPSPSEELAPAHLTEEEGCRCVTPPEMGERCETAEFCQAPSSCERGSMSSVG